jgi:outer membrane protein assembly factor BamB
LAARDISRILPESGKLWNRPAAGYSPACLTDPLDDLSTHSEVHMTTRWLFVWTLLVCTLMLAVTGADWPQWRGPHRNDISQDTGLLKSWPDGGPPLLWTYSEAGVGYSAPAIVGDRLFTMGGEGDHDYVYALDVQAESPRKVWSTEIGPLSRKDRGDGPRGTPTVDGDLLYALSGNGDLVCVETSTGKKHWHANLSRELGGQMMSQWGYSESPLVDGDRLVCTPGGPRGTLAALDKKTGKVLWRSKGLTDPAGYASLVMTEVGGIHQYVVMTGKTVAGVSAEDGRLLWRYAHNSNVAAIPTPIVHDDYVYVTSGYRAGCALIELLPDRQGRIKVKEVYANRNMENHHGGVVLLDGHIYGAWGGNEPRRIQRWVCQDLKTGQVVWQESSKLEKGSLTYADGHFYLYGEENGTTVLIQASTPGWKESGRFTIPRHTEIPRKGKIWTHPVVANGRLYLRDQDLMFCFDVRDRAASAR